MISVFGSKVGEEEISNVTEVMKSQWMGFGKKVTEFENKFSTRLGLQNFAMVDSGSNALFLAVSLLNLPKGSEIILPSFTWVSCAQAILMAGHKPVFCDVDIDTMNVTKKTIQPHITDKTKAIMVVHYAGLPVDMDDVMSLGIPVIEDAAHAVDSMYKGKACGGISEVGIYSYDAVKNLTTGEGGGITAKDPSMIERAKMMRYCGIGKSGFDAASTGDKSTWWEYTIQEPFIKMLPTNLGASIGLAQLDKLDELQQHRKNIWQFYQNEFKNNSWVIPPVNENSGDRHSYFTYCIRVPKRNGLAKRLLDNGIYTTLRYHPLHLNRLYNQMDTRLPNSEVLNTDALSIPIHPNMSMSDAYTIVEKIKNFYRSV